MKSKLKTFLRTQRRLWGLTQKELARLLGFTSSSHLSKLERGKRPPSLKTAVSSYILFGRGIKKLFPRLWEEIEEHVVRRVYKFYLQVEQGLSAKTKRKRELAEGALTRAKEVKEDEELTSDRV